MQLPENAPKPGEFYYHFKHDPEGPIENGAYRIDRVTHDRDTAVTSVSYRGFDTTTEEYRLGMGYAKELSRFLAPIRMNGGELPRYTLIEDHKVLTKLRICFSHLYPEEYTHPARWGRF